MFPLIPAIIFLLLQGSAGADRLPRDLRVPNAWLTLERTDFAGNPKAEAALAQLLEYVVSGPVASAACAPVPTSAGSTYPDAVTPSKTRAPSVDVRLEEGSQECRRSRDGPYSIA